MKPVSYSSNQHTINPQDIAPNALKVLYALNEAGYKAYLVGGAVRDLLLGHKPKDFDIATDAHPEQIKRVFRNCRLIGRRFRLAHIVFGREIIEVATFRASEDDKDSSTRRSTNDSGFLVRDNVYGTIEEDALRRDFTINALYYDAISETIIDYCHGVADLDNRFLRLIGVPEVRFREDPVRMLRAIRFEVKLGFKVDSALLEPIANLGYLLQEVSSARMFDEMIKLLLTGYGAPIFKRLRDYHLFSQVFSLTERSLIELGDPEAHLLLCALENSDSRFLSNQGVSPYFLYAALLWEPYLDEFNSRLSDNVPWYPAATSAAKQILYKQNDSTLIPKRFSILIEELWVFQSRLMNNRSKGRNKLMEHPRFKAAYDFLLLRADAYESDEVVQSAAYWRDAWACFEPQVQVTSKPFKV